MAQEFIARRVSHAKATDSPAENRLRFPPGAGFQELRSSELKK
jgi:hypothetical protein